MNKSFAFTGKSMKFWLNLFDSINFSKKKTVSLIFVKLSMEQIGNMPILSFKRIDLSHLH